MADTTISSLNTATALSANNFIPISDGTDTTKLGTDSLFGFRNRLINGDMRIWQRGTQFNDATGYTADRWFVSRASGNAGITVIKQGTHNPTLRITRNQGNTSTTQFDFRQVIETLNCIDLAAKEVTFSFNAAKESNFTPTACYIEVMYATVADASNISGTFTSLGSRQFNPSTSWQRFKETYTVPSNALTIMARIISGSYVGTAPANDAIEITQLQLEVGPTATPFERRPYGLELSLCQRYYNRITIAATDASLTQSFFDAAFWTGPTAFDGYCHAVYRYPVTMRTTAIATDFSDASTFWYHIGGVAQSVLTSIGGNVLGPDRFRFSCRMSYNNGNGLAGQILARNGYTAYLGFSAEL